MPAYIHVGDTRGTEGIERFTDEEVVKHLQDEVTLREGTAGT